jgi:hypothetical protein
MEDGRGSVMAAAAPRSGQERKAHVLDLLETQEDVWVASADARGTVCQIPLSFAWDGSVLILSTPSGSVTGRNLTESGRVRIALGGTRDVVLIEGGVRTYPVGQEPAQYADVFAAKLEWDPREDTSAAGAYAYFVVSPVKVQSWREANELKGRTLMRDGVWLY